MQRIIGESSALAEALDQASNLAKLNRPVLIVGERGSGKELIAERLHYLSARWDSTLHKVNCAAISEPLLESELFGHEAGAFTGATKTHRGRFERADGGTFFLDELGTMSLKLQEKLLRLIEYGEFERLGGQETIRVDVRIVAATNADLPKMVEENQFRGDLLDRLAFDVINVPPLRERLEDIPQLVAHFTNRMTHELGWEYHCGFTDSALRTLREHHWPGNIRELKNVIERSVYRWGERDEAIDKVIINPFRKGDSGEAKQSATIEHAPLAETEKIDFTEKVKRFELELINRALRACDFHQGKAADHLQLSYHQFRALLRKYKNELT